MGKIRRVQAEGRPEAEAFCIVIPPPNVTGSLHIGHALNNTLQDVLVRFERLRGKSVLWQPGTDHAGIATQMVVERQLAASGGNEDRRSLGPRGIPEARLGVEGRKSGGTIFNQLRRLGASCDWSRERFTMDEGLSAAVLKVFVQLYKEGLIYKDKRLVNWDPHFETAISDLEVENREVHGHFWHFKYPLENGETYQFPIAHDEEGNPTEWETRDYIAIATTRPETMLGDGAVAVHPSDKRYAPIVGKKVLLPLADRYIPIIADEYPDPDFGSGAVKITGAHDFNDYKVARGHDMPMYVLMDTKGRMADADYVPAKYRGLDRFDARKHVVADIEAHGISARRRGQEGQPAVRRSLGRRHRADADRSVVRQCGRTGETGDRGGRERADQVRAGGVGEDLLSMDAQHRALVRLAPALVGPSHSSLVRARRPRVRRRKRSRSKGRSAPALWQGGPASAG